MAVLVTGGAGYIGSHMVWALVDAGEEVVVLDRLSTGFREAVAPGALFYEGDVADRELLNCIFSKHSVDAVVHFAGSVVVPDSVEKPLEYYDNNTIKSHSLIGAVVEAGISNFIFSSTAAVYGSVDDAPVEETSSLRPESPYGTSKLMTEKMLHDVAAAHEFRYTALRYFNVAGADVFGRVGQSTAGATHLIKVACEAAVGKRNGVTVFGTDYDTSDGTCIRDFIHVSDLVNAHLRALLRLRRGAQSLVANCGYGRGFSVLEVINRVRELSGSSFEVSFAPRRPGDAMSVIADAQLAMRELEWQPKYMDLDVILQSALDWEKKSLR